MYVERGLCAWKNTAGLAVCETNKQCASSYTRLCTHAITEDIEWSYIRLLRADLGQILWLHNEYVTECLQALKQLVQEWVLRVVKRAKQVMQ